MDSSIANSTPESLDSIVQRARNCTLCEAHLPFPPRPILRARVGTRILIVGQAPGLRVQETGIPWNDPSGNRLRDWLRLTPSEFYDDSKIAIIPTGLCYPGKGRSGDLPPRPECAPLWHPPLRAALPGIRLTMLIGSHAQSYYLGERAGKTLAETVSSPGSYLPDFLPLPHPSPRNVRWFKLHPWFENEVVPLAAKLVRDILRSVG